MPIAFEADCARLSGVCGVDVAEPLLAWLIEQPHPRVDLAACQHLHTAVLQVLLVARPAVAAEPAEAFLRDCVIPLLGRGGE